MSDDPLIVHRHGDVVRVAFNRPERRNAITAAMYERIGSLLADLHGDQAVRALVLESASDGAFIAGSDISQFAAFSGADDGVAYERRVGRVLDQLEDLPMPTVAIITGACMGAGLALAAACDLRIATGTAVFGLPIARTVGNCLSMNTYSLIERDFGPSRLKDMIIRRRLFTAAEASDFGFVSSLCDPGETEAELERSLERIRSHAPLTMWATKQSLRRLRTAALPDDDDILRRVYGSEDFRLGVTAFGDGASPDWLGR
jgi:enoyl-CoA hydratase/carnithine racemase